MNEIKEAREHLPADNIPAAEQPRIAPEAPQEAAPAGAAPDKLPATGLPAAAPKPPFTATYTEFWAALAMYALAWIWFSIDEPAWLPVFVAGFVALTELLHRQTARARESWFWLGCVLVLTAAVSLQRCNAWDGIGLPLLYLHIFAVWWVLSRSGRLIEGESGRLLPLDALHGFIVFPFKHFFLRIRCIACKLRRRDGEERPVNFDAIVWSLIAVVFAALLFAKAVQLLTTADKGFGTLLEDFTGWLSIEFNWTKLILSLPVGACAFGLIAGSGREDPEALRKKGERFDAWLGTLRQVPPLLFAVLTAIFALLYLAFFVLQGRYLFGAFTRTLPEGFIVSEYARQGFFELCKVMAVNFVLLWLAARLAMQPLRERKLLRACAAVLLAESLLFAVVAASKLGLYIDCFGFTPLRLQSFWLVTVLAAGCVCSLITLFTGKKSFRAWMFFGAATLCLLCLY